MASNLYHTRLGIIIYIGQVITQLMFMLSDEEEEFDEYHDANENL
jgi:hypothetical protein